MSHSKQSGRHISGPTQSLSRDPSPVSGRGTHAIPSWEPILTSHQRHELCKSLAANSTHRRKARASASWEKIKQNRLMYKFFLASANNFLARRRLPFDLCVSDRRRGNVVLSWQPTPKLCRFVLA